MATESWGTCRGHDGMWLPKFCPNRYIGMRVIAFPTFSNMAAVRHLALEFCHSGSPKKSTTYAVWLVCETLVSIRSSPLEILRFYDFASLAGKCLPRPLLGFFWGGGFEPLKIVGRHHNPQKAHSWVRTRYLSHKRLKSVQGCDLGAIARKKCNQDRTGQ